MTKKLITSINIDTEDINYLGESRSFSINGDKGALFSIEVYDDAAGSPTALPNYYNFNTRSWSTEKHILSNVKLNGTYKFQVTFPPIAFRDKTCAWNSGADSTITHGDDNGKIVAGMTVTGPSTIPANSFVKSVTSVTVFELGDALGGTDVDPTGGAATSQTLTFAGIRKYTINVFAETIDGIETKHAPYRESRNIDGTVNLNKSKGSNSSLLSKIIYQDIKKNLILSCIAPSLTTASANTVSAATSGSTDITIDNGDGSTNVAIDPSVVQVGDKVTETGSTPITAGVHALVTRINPNDDDPNEIEINKAASVTNNAAITFTPAFNGMTPNGPISSSGDYDIELSSGKRLTTSFSITCTADAGRNLSVNKTPDTDDLCAYKTVTFESAALALSGEDTDSAAKFFRWPITNIVGLEDGMSLDPARANGTSTDVSKGVNTTTPAVISSYSTTKPAHKIIKREHGTDVELTTVRDVFVEGVDAYGNAVTAIDRNGAVTAQKGNIIFDTQQLDALTSDTGVRIFGHGRQQIKSLTGVDVEISNVVITPTQVSTTTTTAVYGSATIPVAEVRDISAGNTIRGVGIDVAAENPSVSLKSKVSAAGNLTVSAVQTLESGQTLYIDGGSNILTITGDIEVINMGISDTTLYFDVERFLEAN